jgi:transcriptional regulator with XRE-family HTH domain
MTDLVSQLVAIRKAKGIKQATIARRIGISQTAVSQFETGKYSPNTINLLRYAAAVGARITVEET